MDRLRRGGGILEHRAPNIVRVRLRWFDTSLDRLDSQPRKRKFEEKLPNRVGVAES
jgi:hypothetical protein